MSERVIDTSRPPAHGAHRTGDFKPALQLSVDHDLCPGCGEPIALRLVLELIEELGCADDAIGGISTAPHGFGIGSIFDPEAVRARIAGALERSAA